MRPALRVGLLLLLGVVVVLGLLTAFQRHLIYFPAQAVPPPPEGVEEVTVETADGLVISGWLARRSPTDRLVVVFHGNGGNWAGRLPLAEALRAEGVATLLTGYRGYGGNPGTPSEEGLTTDARAWQGWVEDHHDGPVAYFGESIGAAVAARLALDHPPDALVLRSPFTSLADAGRVHYPLLPIGLLLRDTYDVAGRVGDVDAPVVVIAGTADDIVPQSQSREVFEAASQPKRWVEVPGAGHNDMSMLAGADVVEAMVAALDS